MAECHLYVAIIPEHIFLWWSFVHQASPIELNGRQVFVEERRPSSIIFRGGGSKYSL